MKNLKFLVLGILFLGVFMMSCSKEEPTSFEIENATEIMTKFNTGKLDFQQGEVIYGEVYMRSTDDHQLLVFVKNADFDKKTMLYKFQTKKLKNPLFKEIINKAQIFYFHNQLIVNDVDSSRRFSLRFSDANDNLKVDEEGLVISGFGLARTTVDLNIEKNSAVLREDNTNLQSAGGEPGTSQPPGTLGCDCVGNAIVKTCDSGGFGSTSCGGAYGHNDTPCNTTCREGFYACCSAE